MWFPQNGEGTVSQYPIRRMRRWRRIENQLEGGQRLSLPDASASRIEWELKWQDLNHDETSSLQALFEDAGGTCGSFGFVDPLANLVGWSEDLGRPDWTPGLLSCVPGAADPFGLSRAWTVSNGAEAEQTLAQSLTVPGSYVACFSLWLRSDSPTAVFLDRDGRRAACAIGPMWSRQYIGGTGLSDAATFGVTLSAGSSVQAYGFQVEAQPFPSQYKSTRRARGIYPETRFANDELTLTSTGPGRTACDIALISRI